MATITSSGIGSGLDVQGLVSQLVAASSAPLTALNRQINSLEQRQTAFGTIRGQLGNLEAALEGVSSASKLLSSSVTVPEGAGLQATAGSEAAAGSYSVNVTQLAQGQRLAATGQSSMSAAIGSGTVTISIGEITGGSLSNGVYTGASFGNISKTGSITLDGSNNSLAGIRDAINASDLGVRASIIQDGSASPYRLVISSAETGQEQSIRIGVAGDAALQGLLAYDPADALGQNMAQTQAAQNAQLTIDGIAVQSGTNTVAEAIPGVSLELTAAGKGPQTLEVGLNTTEVEEKVSAFVEAYNKTMSEISRLTDYNSASKTSPTLSGESSIRSLRTELRGIALGTQSPPVDGLSRLSDIGVRVQRDGSLSLDKTILQKQISERPEAVASLLGARASSDDSLIRPSLSGSKTVAGSYAVEVTQVPAAGSLTGSAPPALAILAGVNDQLSLTLGGLPLTVQLNAGAYGSADELATALQTQLRANPDDTTGLLASLSVTVEAGLLKFGLDRLGADSTIRAAGTAGLALLGGAGVALDGQSAAGTIDGVAATGAGRSLFGAEGSASEGLRLEILGGTTGPRGTATVDRGFGDKMRALIDNALADNGLLDSRTDSLAANIDRLEDRADRMQDRLDRLEKQYLRQYTALDTALASLNSTASALSAQLSGLSIS